MKSKATPRVTRMTGEPMENSFFTSSPSPRADLMGGIVPVESAKMLEVKENAVHVALKLRDAGCTYCHHSPLWQTGSSGCHTQHCCMPSSWVRTRWPHAAHWGRAEWWSWLWGSARPRCLWAWSPASCQWWGSRRWSIPAGWVLHGWSWCGWAVAGPCWTLVLWRGVADAEPQEVRKEWNIVWLYLLVLLMANTT